MEYANALAQLAYTADGLYGGNANSAYVLGVCAGKSSQTRGIVVFGGQTDGIDFSAATEDGNPLDTGPYFLSATAPGKITRDRPAVGIYVLFGQGNNTAVIAPSPREVLENHVHYRVPMKYGNIIDGSGGVGWSSVIDLGIAPVGAIYRYVIEDDPELYKLFPFAMTPGVYFEIDGIGANEKVIIDLNGIWWIDTGHTPTEYSELVVYYSRPSLSTSQFLVRTLQPQTTDSPLSVVDCNGNPAIAGDLYLRLNLQFEQQDENTAGWLVFKELTTSQQFKRGPVVQRVRSASPEISVSLNGGTEGYTWTDGFLSGDLILTYNSPTGSARSLDPTLTELYGALQEDYNGIPYLAFPPNAFESGVQFRFDVPSIGLAGNFNMTFSTWIYSSTAGSFPTGGLMVEFIIIRSVTSAAAKQLSDVLSVIRITGKSITLLPNATMNANGYRLGTCSDLDSEVIQPGDQVLVKVSRNDSSYAGTIGILKAWSEITQA